MSVDVELERLYGRVRLVRGKGSRRSGGLCIMSFVALLAGERHSDAPAAASPMVRQFAVVLNDAMPDAERQRLKPFAPRILGTADGFDPGRAALLRQAMQRAVLPRIHDDLRTGALPSGALSDPCGVAPAQPASAMLASYAALAAADDAPRSHRQLALHAARLLSACAVAVEARARPLYWSMAIDILDRMCDVGARPAHPALTASRIARLLSDEEPTLTGGVRRLAATLRRLGHALA
jgi:hypothetical protein